MGIFLKNNLFFLTLLVVLFFPRSILAQEQIRIVINEFLPNPVGSDTTGEWIELKNLGESDISMAGWKLCDKANRCFKFQKENIVVGGFLTLDRAQTKISINNSDETLSLITPSGEVAFKIGFSGTAKEGQSFSRFGKADWRWTAVTTKDKENFWLEEKTDLLINTQKEKDVAIDNNLETKNSSNQAIKENDERDITEKLSTEASKSRSIIILAIVLGFLFSGLGAWLARKFLKS